MSESISRKYQCPCCGYYTFPEKPGGSYDICPVCFWEDDAAQLRDEQYAGGANRVSLAVARENYASFGACEESMRDQVREPLEDEKSGIDWMS